MKKIILIALCIFSFGKINAQIQTEQKTGTYRLVVSFISKGSGIDGKSMGQIKKFIENHTPKVSYETCQMGREGETNLLFHLTELSKKQQKKFVKEVKENIADATLVFVKENEAFNSPCRVSK